MNPTDIDIIGGGIGGLTTAISLQRIGITVNVYEKAKEIKPVGAGIILANNAMQVYEKLGIRNEIEKNGNPISTMNITDEQLRLISNIDLKYFELKHKVQNIAIHRGQLQQILSNHLKPNTLHLGHDLVQVKKNKGEFISKFRNGNTIASKILLGADGLNSTVRNNLFGNYIIRNANQLCWRGIANISLPKKFKSELNEAWGKGIRFGFVSIAPNKVYWYALTTYTQNHNHYSINNLSNVFDNFTPIVSRIINETSVSDIHKAIISDLKPIKKWYKGNICLIGDAAHATTPNMGQGACQAIEDAFVLAECLQKNEVNKAFSEFQKIRMTKAHRIVNMSWTLGKLAHWNNPIAIKIRNQIMRITPKSINRKQSEKIFQLSSI